MFHVCSSPLAALLLISSSVLAGCASTSPAQIAPSRSEAFPDSVNAFGDGYPDTGAPCRRLGESLTTSNYLDHTRTLAGCLRRADAEALGGKIVGHVEGVWMVSIPTEEPSA